MTWWQRLWRRKQMEEQLEKELRFHVDQQAADLMARGHGGEEAQRQAKLSLGGVEQVKEHCRDARGTRRLEDLGRDFRYALRSLRQHPGFAAVALLTLALGTGATTVLFTVVNGVLLKPLPYVHPDRLVTLHGQSETWNAAAFGEQHLAYSDFLDFRRATRSLELAGTVYNPGTLETPGEAEHVERREVSSNFFSLLGVPLWRGRTFSAEEDGAGGTPVLIVGYTLWQRRFAGSSEVVGKQLVLDGKPYTVVGIAAAGFRPDGAETDVYTPLGQDTAGYMRNRQAHPVAVLGRLRPGVTQAQGQMDISLIGRHLAEQYRDSNAGRTFVIEALRPEVGDVRSTLWLLLGAVSLVLLIACANIASLLLARAVSRERELALRIALGAGRSRLVRQSLTESAVLGLAGGALGLLLAAVTLHPFVAFWPGSLPRAEDVQLDWRVLWFALGVSLANSFLFGVAPAMRAPKRDLEQRLRAGVRAVAGSSMRLHGGFVVSEIALAVVLLVSAGMLGRTLLHLSSLNPGVNVRNVLVTRLALAPSILSDPARMRAAWEDILNGVGRVPGVESVAMVDTVPMREGNNQLGYWPSADMPRQNKRPLSLATSVSPNYLKVMGIPLREGRFFNERDRLGNELVIVIDEVLARHAFPGSDPVGKRLWVPDMSAGPVRVIGVVGHVRNWGLAGDDRASVRDQLYYPFAQVPDALVRRWSELMSIAVRTAVAPLSAVEALRREVRGATGDQVIYEVRTMEQLTSDSLARQRFLLILFGIFAGLALLLACVGLYGVLAYLTGQRVPEIGVRIALGASGGSVTWLVLRQSLGMILLGIGLGVPAAFVAGGLLERLVPGMQPKEVSTFVITIFTLVAAGLLASFLPARRASRVDPMMALRQE